MKQLILDKYTNLREIQLTDADNIFAAVDSQRDYLGRFLPFVASTRTVNHTKAFIKSIVDVKLSIREYLFVINYHKAFAGLVGFKNTDYINMKTEIGYWICEEYQGHGIITRSVQTLCNFAFSELDMNRIQIKCIRENYPGKRIPMRLKFIFEGIEREAELRPGGEFSDVEVYSKLKQEWI